jgi:hypothetical protein
MALSFLGTAHRRLRIDTMPLEVPPPRSIASGCSRRHSRSSSAWLMPVPTRPAYDARG